MQLSEPISHTQVPVNIGSSVIAMKYKDGVIIAADCAISYGSLQYVKNASRIEKIDSWSAFAASGEMSDF